MLWLVNAVNVVTLFKKSNVKDHFINRKIKISMYIFSPTNSFREQS